MSSLTLAVSLISQPAGWYIILGVVAYLVLVTMVASYGNSLGYPFFPLFACTLLLPFGVPIVLLVVTICAGPRKSTALYEEGQEQDVRPRPRAYTQPRDAVIPSR